MHKCISLAAQSINTRNDVTTITVADDALQGIIPRCDCPRVNICISTSFAVERECTRIEVTDGTSTLPIAKCNQYWRPRRLKCNSTLQLIYRDDPQLLVFVGGVSHG